MLQLRLKGLKRPERPEKVRKLTEREYQTQKKALIANKKKLSQKAYASLKNALIGRKPE